MTGLHDLEAALALIGDHLRPVEGRETCGLDKALGRVTAHAVTAPYALPRFDNTSVDGYAFRYREGQTMFRLAGGSFAGEPFAGILQDGEATRIATGAMLPKGADTVAMQEDCGIENGMVTIQNLPPKGSSIRHEGADIKAWAEAVPKGRYLRPQDIALLGALGLKEVEVLRPLRVAIASTGQELATAGMSLQPGQIIDTNSLMLAQMMMGLPVLVEIIPPLPDNYEATHAALAAAAEKFDLIVTTGGVSVGDRDFVRDVFRDQGHILFWKLAIRPGKPVMVGQMGSCALVGLPGNPVSAFVTFFLIVRPAIDALFGRTPALPPAFTVRLAQDMRTPGHLRCFSRARMENGTATPVPDQSSNLYTSLTSATGLLDLPQGSGEWRAGQDVLFRPFSGLL